ncbi:hypothetical protein D3C72_2335160 [compost metagenome]
MREHDIGDVARRDAARVQIPGKLVAHAECAHVDQDLVFGRAQQGAGAPAQAAVADRASGVSLNQNIDLVHGFIPP